MRQTQPDVNEECIAFSMLGGCERPARNGRIHSVFKINPDLLTSPSLDLIIILIIPQIFIYESRIKNLNLKKGEGTVFRQALLKGKRNRRWRIFNM